MYIGRYRFSDWLRQRAVLQLIMSNDPESFRRLRVQTRGMLLRYYALRPPEQRSTLREIDQQRRAFDRRVHSRVIRALQYLLTLAGAKEVASTRRGRAGARLRKQHAPLRMGEEIPEAGRGQMPSCRP